jgi:hypothetical protein
VLELELELEQQVLRQQERLQVLEQRLELALV